MTMKPSDQAAGAIALWEAALRQQRAAEARLDAARRKKDVHMIITLQADVQRLRTRADLLLAEAVEIMHKDIFGG